MDRHRTLAAFAVGIATAIGVGIGGAALSATARPLVPVLREMRWIDPGLPRADVVRLLTTEPAECLITATRPAASAEIEIGRAAFRSPLLLGGQAARAGISCESCHRAGHGNQNFVFPGVSGAPGTADVTSSLFSSKRGDGLANPRSIPDLTSGPARIDRDPASPTLRHFIRGLVVDEFDGLEVSDAVLDGLVAYVRALGGACSADVTRTVVLEADTAIAAAGAAKHSLSIPDATTARLLIGAARSALGRIDERYAVVPGINRRLNARDIELRRMQEMAVSDPAAAAVALDRWIVDFSHDIATLRKAEDRSLYSAVMLEKTLATGP